MLVPHCMDALVLAVAYRPVNEALHKNTRVRADMEVSDGGLLGRIVSQNRLHEDEANKRSGNMF